MGLNPPRAVIVVPHDVAWPAAFTKVQRRLSKAVPGALSIEHVGSTSVPGLAAKPTIDILMVVQELASALDRLDALTELGFEHRPGAFATERRHLFLRRVVNGERTHHLHVLESTSHEPDEYRLFRDYLTANPDQALRY